MTLTLRNRYHATKLVMLFGWLFVVVIIPLQAKWEKLEACRLVDHGSNDGDSFRVEVPDGRQLQFRLYFVDTPELGLFYPDRVKEQADYFGINQQAVLDLGSQASAFTKGFLRDKKFTVLTEWKDAWGLQNRYAALVHCENKSLIEALVGNGLVRLRGFQTDGPLPGGSITSDYQNLLRRIEKKAKSDRVGGWGISIGKQNTRFLGVDRIDPTQKADKIGGDEIVLILHC